MQLQLFTRNLFYKTPKSWSEPSESLIEPIRNQIGFIKADGGLWTSTYHPKYGSDWVREYDSMFDLPEEGLDGWLLTPHSEARIFTVDTLDDLLELHERYPLKNNPVPFIQLIDYEWMAKEYDGLHLTEQGQWNTRLSEPHLYGWDSECTHWFRWCFEKVEYIGKVGV